MKTALIFLTLLAMTGLAFGQSATRTSSVTTGTASTITDSGTLVWTPSSFTLVDPETDYIAFNVKIESVKLTDSGLEVVKSDLRYLNGTTLFFNGAACTGLSPCKANTLVRHVWKEIYGIKDGKLALLRTVDATVIPAKDEEIVWPRDKQ